MTFRSPSTPSEGEIVESDSEKATTSLRMINDTNVDSRSRIRASVSPSLSPYRSPRRRPSRTPSRSPFREARGAKRYRDSDHESNRPRNDSRYLKIRYDDRSAGLLKTSRSKYIDTDRSLGSDSNLRYEDRGSYVRLKPNRPRTRSRSPFRNHPSMSSDGWRRSNDKDFKGLKHLGDERDSVGYTESRKRLSTEQSVSDRGQSSVAAAPIRRDAETGPNQDQPASGPFPSTNSSTSESMEHLEHVQHPRQVQIMQPVDEATLIEERRKRREAIKAKYRDKNDPISGMACLSSKALAPLDYESGVVPEESQVSIFSHKSPPLTPKMVMGQDSPTGFVVVDDADLANSGTGGAVQEDEPSAADYDPTMDMQEDQLRYDQHHRDEETLSTSHKKAFPDRHQDFVPEVTATISTNSKRKDEYDMFAEGDELDVFEEAAIDLDKDGTRREEKKATLVPQAKALDMSMLDDWDDHEGYYKVILGELLDARYHIQSNLGKGMFSGVVRATDQKTMKLVAIKIIRNNESMKKAGLKEIEILQKLCRSDPEDRKHIIRLERFFEHKGHLCMVFENLSVNLREVLKKFGRDVGINLKAVRAYAHQMFLGLCLLRKCNILHADLKPDNVLVNESRNILKICDLGSASDASENEITPYLVSRFYRAPEIILGMPYDFGIDVWSVGCTLFELYTGKILFTGRSNNQMLRSIMECRGKFSHKILRKAQFARLHFDDLLNFRSMEKDKLSDKDVVRVLNFTKPTRDLKTRLLANSKGLDDVDMKELNLFLDLLERCLHLNPEKRCTPNEALRHPFVTRIKV